MQPILEYFLGLSMILGQDNEECSERKEVVENVTTEWK